MLVPNGSSEPRAQAGRRFPVHPLATTMQRIYSHPDPAIVQIAASVLEGDAIETVVRGSALASVAGGGAAASDTWTELWLVDESQLVRATEAIEAFIAENADDTSAESWTCPACGELVEAPLAVCWSCGAHQPS